MAHSRAVTEASPSVEEGTPQYEFHSDLAQYCFPAASRDNYAKYAYANSVFLAFLIIGVVGILKAPVITAKELPALQEFLPVELPPPAETPPPPEVEQIAEPDTEEAPPEAFQPLVVAAADAPVNFAMPVDTTNVVIAKIADLAPPPPRYVPPDRPPAPMVARVERFRPGGGGVRGIFPTPPNNMHTGLVRPGESVSLLIYFEVAADGTKTKVEIKESSGVSELDRRVLQYVKNRWRFDPPGEPKYYECPFEFRM